jgi:hypothetical protein
MRRLGANLRGQIFLYLREFVISVWLWWIYRFFGKSEQLQGFVWRLKFKGVGFCRILYSPFSNSAFIIIFCL